MLLRRLLCAAALASAALPLSAPAQQSAATSDKAADVQNKSAPAADKPTTLSVDARLVNLPVIVRDKKGALIQNLTKADFALSVDGHPQTIRYFDRDQDLPLTLGLLVDTSMSQRGVLDEERAASGTFLDTMLTAPANHPPDKAFVIQFARSTELLQDLTDSRPKLQAALKELDTPNRNDSSQNDPQDTQSDPNSNGSGSGGGNSGSNRRNGGYRHTGGTTLYDAVFLSSDELMSKQHGRKALIILSDGVDNASKESLARSIESAQRADTIIYAIYYKGEQPRQDFGNRGGGYPGGGNRGGIGFPGGGYPGGGYPGGGGGGRNGGGQPRGGNENRVDGKKILERMATETGGRLFEVSKKQNVESIYTQIAEELRSQYRLGYTPDSATASDGYHKIDLDLPKQKNDYIQTRDGYYTGTDR